MTLTLTLTLTCSGFLSLSAGADMDSVLGGRDFEAHVTLLPMVSEDMNASYPINTLRNLAIRAVRTSHFIVLDVDLWPSASLYHAVMAAPEALLRSKYARARVVPAFELDRVSSS